MDLNSTRTAANTITPAAETPKPKYGERLLDYYAKKGGSLTEEYKDPARLAQLAYEKADDKDAMDYDTWSAYHGISDFMEKAPTIAATRKEAADFEASKPADRGFLAGTGAALGRGAMNVVGAVGQTLGLADLTPASIDTEKGYLDTMGEGMTKWAEGKKENTQFMRPTMAEEADENGVVKKAWEGGVESIVTSAAPMAAGFAGAKAGAAVGSVFGPVGTAVGSAVGGLGAYGLARFGMFGAGVYGDTYDKTYAELKQKNPGMAEDEARRIANKGAWTDAISENVSEAVGDAAAFYTFGGTKILQQPLKATIKDVMKRGIKGVAGDVARQMPFEVGSEVANAAVGAQWRQEAGLEGGDVNAAMLDAIGPAVVMSLLMGGGVAGYTEVKARKALNDINAADPNVRAKTANEIALQIKERTKDEELAETWRKEAFARIESGDVIPIDEKIAEFGANKARIDAVDNGEDVAVIPDETEVAEAAAVESPLSPAESLLTDGVKTTPEDVLMGTDVVAPPTVSETEDLDAEWNRRMEDRQVEADARALDAEWDTRQRIQELDAEIKRLSTGRGKGTKKRLEAAQVAKQERKRLIDQLAQGQAQAAAQSQSLSDLYSAQEAKSTATEEMLSAGVDALFDGDDDDDIVAQPADAQQPAPQQNPSIPYDTVSFVGEGQPLARASGESPLINFGDRIMTVRVINGVQVPFYLSSGHGGKKDVPSGKWYPFFGIGADGWINKTGGQEMTGYYGMQELRAAAEELDATIGDVRGDKSVPRVSKGGRHIDFLNTGFTPAENAHSTTPKIVRDNIENLRQRLSQNSAPAVQDATVTSDNLDAEWSKRQAEMEERAALLRKRAENLTAPEGKKNSPAREAKLQEVQAELQQIEAAQLSPAPDSTVAPPSAVDEGAISAPEIKTELDAVANEAATSPLNDTPEPTQAQKEAGNYKKGHVRINGLDFSIENPKGSERKGVDKDGRAWSTTMRNHYAYIKGSVGADKDHVDAFLSGAPESGRVFIVDQVDPKTGAFDEHKAMVGFETEEQAREAYLSNYSEGWQGLGAITPMEHADFKKWVFSKKTKKPVGDISKADRPAVSAETVTAPVQAEASTISQEEDDRRWVEDNQVKPKIRARIADGKKATINFHSEHGFTAGYGSVGYENELRLNLTKEEHKAASRINADIELADTPEERESARAALVEYLEPAVQRALDGERQPIKKQQPPTLPADQRAQERPSTGILGQSQPQTWREVGAIVDLLNKEGGMRLSPKTAKDISNRLGISERDTNAAFNVFMGDIEGPSRAVPNINIPEELSGKSKPDQETAGQRTKEQAGGMASPGQRPSIDGYASTITDKMSAGRIKKKLSERISYKGKAMTRAEYVEAKLGEGYEPATRQEPKVKEMSRMASFRANNEQQRAHEKKMREAGNKTVYSLDKKDEGVSVDVTKIEHDYAVWVGGPAATATPVQERAEAPASKQDADKGQDKKKVGRWFDAVRAWSNGEKFANVRPDIVERAWDDDSLVKRSEISAFVDWLEKNKVDSYRVERMRRIIETLKGERTGKYYITIHKGIHGPDRIEMKIDANGDGVSESSEYVATMEEARRIGKQKGLEHALDGDGAPSISYLRGNTVVSHKPNSTAKIEKTDDGYRFFYSDTGMTVDKKTLFDMKAFLDTQFFDGWQAMRADFDRLKNDGAVDEAAESRAEMMSVNIFDLKKLAADLKIGVEKDATKEWIVNAILNAKSPEAQQAEKTPEQRADAAKEKQPTATATESKPAQESKPAESQDKSVQGGVKAGGDQETKKTGDPRDKHFEHLIKTKAAQPKGDGIYYFDKKFMTRARIEKLQTESDKKHSLLYVSRTHNFEFKWWHDVTGNPSDSGFAILDRRARNAERDAAAQQKTEQAPKAQKQQKAEQKTDFTEEINKIYRVLHLGPDAYTFGDNKGQQFRRAEDEARALLKAYKKKYGWSDEFAADVWKKASKDMLGPNPNVVPVERGTPVEYNGVPSPEWVQINRDKTVEADIPEAQKEKLTLKQQKAWLLAEIDKAIKSGRKDGKPFEFHVPGDGHFRIKPDFLATFKQRVVERFPEKERPSALGKNTPVIRDPKTRITDGEYYNEWQDYEVKVDSVIKPGYKDDPFPAWDAKTNALHDATSMLVLDKKPLLKGLKNSVADTGNFIAHTEKTVTEPAEIVGQLKRQDLDEDAESRRLMGNKKTRDMLNEQAKLLAQVFAHVRYGDKDAFFPAERIDMLRTQFPNAKVKVDKAGSMIGFFEHGKLLGVTMAVQGIELSDYHKARIEEIKAAKEGRSVGNLAAKTKVETPELTKEEQDGVDLLVGLAKGEIKAEPNAGARKATKTGLARVAEAKKAMADIVNNPDIVGKDRANRIEHARNLVNFLETNAANDLDTGYEQGDKVAYTGEDSPEGMRAFIYLEGAKAGQTGVAATKESKAARAEKAQDDFKKQQEEFRRLRENRTFRNIDTLNALTKPVEHEDWIKFADGSEWQARQGYTARGWTLVRDGKAHPTIQSIEGQVELVAAIVQQQDALKTEKAKPEDTGTADAGQELTHNKRNRVNRGLSWSDLKDMNPTLRTKEAVKSKIIPKPDYQAMVDGGMHPAVVYIFKQVYDSIAAKPKPISRAQTADEAIQLYIDSANRVLEEARKWAEDGRGADWVLGIGQMMMRSRGGKGPISISDVTYQGTAPSPYGALYPNGWRESRDEINALGGNRYLSGIQPGESELVKAMKDIDKGWPGTVAAWKKQGYSIVKIGEMKPTFYVGEDHKKQPYVYIHLESGRYRLDSIKIDGAASATDPRVLEAVSNGRKQFEGKQVLFDKGRRAVSAHENEADAESAAEAVTRKKKGGAIKEDGYSVEDSMRTGVEHRMNGEDVTSEKLMEQFGFKGVNFGNWMKGKSNEAERQMHINMAYDSFMDLAQILNVPPRAMSLNGLLGLAIGAQGTGSAAAHFVPGVNEINLTRASGAGAVAHEWAHGLDHYFANIAGLSRSEEPFITEHTKRNNIAIGEMRPEVMAKFAEVVKAMERAPMSRAEIEAQVDSRKSIYVRNIDSWLKSMRQSYMHGITDTLMVNKNGKSVNFAEEFDRIAARIRAGDVEDGKIAVGRTTFVSPVVAELRDLYMLKKVGNQKTRAYSLEDFKSLQANVDSILYYNSERAQDKVHEPQTKGSDYANESLKADKDKKGKRYWSTKLEMFARAFAGYVYDRLEAEKSKNSYLVRPSSADSGEAKAYAPVGEDRKRINAAFDALVKELKTRETDKGVAMYQVATSTPSPIDLRAAFPWADSIETDGDGRTVITKGKVSFAVTQVETISPDEVSFKLAYGRKPGAQDQIAGEYRASEIRLSKVADQWTVQHEYEHFLEDMGLITKFEQAVLDAAIKKAEKDGTLKFDPGTGKDRMKPAELRAYYVQHELAARDFQRKTTLGRVMQKVADFIDALANLFVRTSKGVVRDVASGKMMTRPTAEQRKFMLPMLQAAYHGTPYRGIEKFLLDKIGTGEGNQAFGWGLYFSNRKEIADWYKDSLGDRTLVDNNGREFAPGDPLYSEAQEAGLKRKEPGQTYKVDLPDDTDMLHWDKTLDAQPAGPKKALTKAISTIRAMGGEIADNPKGNEIYFALEKALGSDKAASESLNTLGVVGIKYLDGISRGAGDGTYNFVIFDENAIEILETYYQVMDGMRGFQAKDVTETPAFKKWSGGAPVVMAGQTHGFKTGSPVVVQGFHGGKKDLAGGAFRIGMDGATFFSSNKHVAKVHKIGVQGGGVHDVFVRFTNPYVIDYRGSNINQDNAEAAVRDAKAGGHDGVIIKNFIDIPGDKLDVAQRFGVAHGYNGNVYAAFEPTQIKSVDNSGAFDPADARIQYAMAPTLQKAREFKDDLLTRPEVFGVFNFINTQLHKALRQPAFRRVFDRFHAAAGTQQRAAARAASLAPDILPDHSGKFKQSVRELFTKTRDFSSKDLQHVSRVMSMETLSGKNASPFSGHRLTDDELTRLEDGETVTVGGNEISMNAKQMKLYRQSRAALDQMLTEMATSEAWRIIRGVLTKHQSAAGEFDARDYWEVFANQPNEAGAAMQDMLQRELEKGQARLTQAEMNAHAIAGADDMDGFKAYGKALTKLNKAIDNKEKFSKKQLEDGDLDEIIAKREERIEKLADELGIDASDAEEKLKEYKGALKEYNDASQHVENVNGAFKQIEDVFNKSDQLIKAGYAPLSRFGKYRIDVLDDEGKLIHVSFYDSSTEAARERRSLVRAFDGYGGGANVGAVETVSQEDWKQFQGANPEALRMFAQKAGAESEEVMQAYYQNAISSRSALKRLINRQGYAGYSEDLQRIMASFITSGSKRVGSNYHAADIAEMVNDKAIPADLRDEASKLKQFIDNPGDAGSGFRSFAANWYMLGSMMSAAWNGTQVFTSTTPELYKHGGSVVGAFGEVLKGYRSLIRKGADLSVTEKAALKRAMEDGTVDAAEIHHLYAQATKRFVHRLGDGEASKRVGAFLRLWGMPFSWFEVVNRKASFIAAYRMGEAQGVDDAYAFAKQIVDITQGIYAKHNRPNMARGAVMGSVMTFMQYKIMTLEQIARNAKEGGQARKAAALQLAIIAAMGGWKALPGIEDITDIYDTIMQVMFGKAVLSKKSMREAIEKKSIEAAGLILEKEAAEAVGQFFANAVNNGIVTAALPVDVSGRAGMGGLIPGLKLLKPSTQYRDSIVFDMAGVPGSMLDSLIDASGMILQGDMGRAAMRLAPNAVAAVAKGADILATGEIRNTRGKKVTDGSQLDAALQALGGQPKEKSRINTRLRENQELKFLTQSTEKSIVAEWADAYEKKGVVAQREALVAVRKRIADWNSANPDWPIVVKQSQVMNELKNRKKTTVELASKSAPKELRKSMAVQ